MKREQHRVLFCFREVGIERITVGPISDTHGLLRPEVASALKGCSMILHAGDVGEGVLDKLQRISTTVP